MDREGHNDRSFGGGARGAARGAASARVGRAAAVCALGLLAAACTHSPTEPPSATPGPYVVTIDLAEDVAALGSEDEDGSDDRAQAAEAHLNALGPAVRPALLAAIDREDAPVRAAAAEMLAGLPDASDDPVARRRLERLAWQDPDPAVRASAVGGLGQIGAAESKPTVEAALRDADDGVRLAAAGACPGLCDSDEALSTLARMAIGEKDVGHGLSARRILLRLRTQSELSTRVSEVMARTAREALDGGPPEAEASAARAALLLADLGDPRGTDALLAAVGGSDSGPLRVHVVFALGQIGGPEAVAPIAKLLPDAGIALYAHDALRRMAAREVDGAEAALVGYDGPRSEKPLGSPYAF